MSEQQDNPQQDNPQHDKKEKIVKEFPEEELELIKQFNEEFSEDIELVIRKCNDGDYEFRLKYSDHSPGEIAQCLKEIDEAGIRNIVNLCLVSVKERDPLIFSRITKIFLKKLEVEEGRDYNTRIMAPSQVFRG